MNNQTTRLRRYLYAKKLYRYLMKSPYNQSNRTYNSFINELTEPPESAIGKQTTITLTKADHYN